ncbi:UvrD-helicase domain-containing protein [Delftia sp. CH05]|uniref:UvrD-helicase domain-containing protein n=1 Tax=Delftia sp. CH05 TaxID=2692194 RepID=UPI00135D52A2|nr:UvrD-helicase domain-containing protein [Delftia sp. CH05]MXN28141.1 AAA family ATPase [Delftia sp. CH05]
MTAMEWTNTKQAFLASTGNVLAMGGPGSGKTHVALVKARDEIRSGALQPGQRILFLSFARPTVARIVEKAKELISAADFKLLEVNTYHGFAWDVLRSHGYLLNDGKRLKLLPPPEGAARLAHIAKEEHHAEKLRLFHEEGLLHFDLFAQLTAQLFSRSQRLTGVYASTYPLLVVDEFQDTNADEWAMVRELASRCRVIALADPDQRIYEFRGADPNRLKEFSDQFAPQVVEFQGENHRSPGTDIATFGADLLTGKNRGALYNNVSVVEYGFLPGRSAHFQMKAQLIQSIRRLKKSENWSVAVLVPSKALMLQVSDYLSGEKDGFPTLYHDVAMDAESPALAADVIATVLEGGHPDALKVHLINAIHTHIRGRNGSKGPAQAELGLADAMIGYLGSGKIRGKNREALVADCGRIAEHRQGLAFSGGPEEDWRTVRELFAQSKVEQLSRIAADAKYLRLLHKGSALRASLADVWRRQGKYVGAVEAVRNALVQEHFTAALKEWRGIHLMTIHKAKGKEFDEVLIYEGLYTGRIVPTGADEARTGQARLALRVAVTRAMKRATILSPRNEPCIFL